MYYVNINKGENIMQKKMAIGTILTMVVFMLTMVGSFATTNSVNFVVNNEFFKEVPSVYENGILLAGAKEIAQSVGGTFHYDYNKMTGTFTKGSTEIVFRLDNKIVLLNGKYISAPAGMKVLDMRIMVPMKFCFEKLGTEIYEDSSRKRVLIFKDTEKLVYSVVSGDSLWVLSNLFKTTINSIKSLNGLKSDVLFINQKLVIKDIEPFVEEFEGYSSNYATVSSGTSLSVPVVGYLKPWVKITINGKNGNWYSVKTPVGNGYLHSSVTFVKQDISDYAPNSNFFSNTISVDTSKNYITYNDYIVQMGDNLWSVSEKMGIPNYELAGVNGLADNSILKIGQILKVPVHNIPVKSTPDWSDGEIMDWFYEGQYVFPIGAKGKVTDLETGKSFMIKRTIGANHSDTETLTSQDTKIMKEIFGGVWTWNSRPFILEVSGRRVAVSISGMPHAGVDGIAFLKNVNNRSGDWGYGPNYDSISDNNMDGHFDLYFLNCLRHKDSKVDSSHQQNVMIAGGLK